jgi:hypothetical protein
MALVGRVREVTWATIEYPVAISVGSTPSGARGSTSARTDTHAVPFHRCRIWPFIRSWFVAGDDTDDATTSRVPSERAYWVWGSPVVSPDRLLCVALAPVSMPFSLVLSADAISPFTMVVAAAIASEPSPLCVEACAPPGPGPSAPGFAAISHWVFDSVGRVGGALPGAEVWESLERHIPPWSVTKSSWL